MSMQEFNNPEDKAIGEALVKEAEVDLASDAAAITTSDEGLKKVATLAKKQIELMQQISEFEDLLKSLGEELKQVQEFQLPEAMSELGLSEFKTDTGHKITVKPYYSAKLDDQNRDEAFGWLRNNGHEDLIKHEITVPLGRGMEGLAQDVKAFLQARALSFTDKEGVHHSTLNAFFKEQIEGGANFPIDLFKGYIGRKTKITIK